MPHTDPEYVEAIPVNGDVKHAIRRAAMKDGRRFSLGGALCGVRGRDAWGGGGMRPVLCDGQMVPFTATEPNPDSKTTWDGKQLNEWCPKCIRLVVRSVATS
jgi:hypothetical protein